MKAKDIKFKGTALTGEQIHGDLIHCRSGEIGIRGYLHIGDEDSFGTREVKPESEVEHEKN